MDKILNLQFIILFTPIIIAIAATIKQTGIPKKYIPFINILTSICISALYSGLDLKNSLITGIVTGLASNGTYDITKSAFKKEQKQV